ncbi:MAG: hypothetical protein PHW29_01710 [Flavobacterium sp.]|jgi:hypothetical protein|nr:hypothetical protein [Flavobacterium sp.]
MDNLNKLIFLEITNKQFTKFPDSDYYKTLELLSETDKEEFYKLADEIHEIWNNLNTPKNFAVNYKVCNSFEEYRDQIQVSSKISKIINDFNLDLKDEMSDEVKKSIIALLGKDFFDQTFGK